jgi:predicted nucleic acid-binding protein
VISKVFIDANVLYSRTLRDWMFLLRASSDLGFMTLATSEDAIVEAQGSFRKNNPTAPGWQIAKIRETTIDSIDELVVDYTVLSDPITSDHLDNHIIAAAEAWNANYLITSDKGFETLSNVPELLDAFEFEVYKPDDFFMLVADSAPELVRGVAVQQQKYWSSKRTSKSLVHALQEANCPQFAQRIDRQFRDLSGA